MSATAFTLRDGEWVGPFFVDNLSAGGALLVGGSQWRVGETLELKLRLDDGSEVLTSASVLRCEQRREERVVAVQFQDPSADVEDAIHDAVMAGIERSRAEATACIVVVTSWPHDVEAMSMAISRSGATPLIVTTFLDALRWLQDPRVLVKALIVDVDAESGLGMESMAWCAEEFPAVRRVLLAPESDGVERRKWPRRTCTVLARPVTPRRLARALGRASARRRIRAQPATSSPR